MSSPHAPSLIGYADYRKYLKDLYHWLKQVKPQFSHRYFAKKAATSSALLKLVMDGRRNLTPATTEKFINGLGLRGTEADYFRILVRYTQAVKDVERNRHFTRLRQYMERRKVNTLPLDQYDYLSNWYLPIIREMIPCQGFQKDALKIRNFLFDEVTAEQVVEALQLLMRLGFIQQGKNGMLEQKTAHLRTDDSIAPLALKNYHREFMRQAIKAIERSHPDEREIRTLTLSADPDKIPLAKKRVQEFFSDMRELLSGPNNRQVYQVNLQLFNLTKDHFPA